MASIVSAGQTVSGQVLAGSASLTVNAGGTAVGITVSSGADLAVMLGGTATGTVVSGGYLDDHGSAGATNLVAGSALVGSTGNMSGVTVGKNATLTVTNGGVASAVTVLAGGFAIVSSGGGLTGVSVNSGGYLGVFPGAAVTSVFFSPGATIDFDNIPFSANASATLNAATDVLTVTNGSTAFAVQLVGGYGGYAFSTTIDNDFLTNGQGIPGTLVTLVPNVSSTLTGPTSGTVNVNGNANTVVVNSGTVTLAAGVSGNTVTLGGGPVTATENGNDTIRGGSGADTVNVGSSSTSTVVVGGTGPLTFNGGAGNAVVFAGTGGLTFNGGSGYSIVVGGGNPSVINGSTGGGAYFGGGNAVIRSNDALGVYSVLVGANGDQLYSSGVVGDLFGDDGPGDLLMSGINSAGNDVFFGAAGTGKLTFITGTGNDLLGLGQGTNVVTLGAGHCVVFGNTGTTAVSTITTGSGAADIGFGGKSVALTITAAPSPRAITLYNTVFGADKITLSGYAAGMSATALASQQVSAGSTVMTLGDGSLITLIGLTHADATLFA
jgi:autotransporter passenger strand-loop-strand repeat protein